MSALAETIEAEARAWAIADQVGAALKWGDGPEYRADNPANFIPSTATFTMAQLVAFARAMGAKA